MHRPSPATVRRLILVLILALWELVPRTGVLPELFLPALSKTLTVLVQNWGEYAHALVVTLYEVALAMVIACGGGILVGALWLFARDSLLLEVDADDVLTWAVLLAGYPLLAVGRYAGMRYKLSRTRWRGIRGGCESCPSAPSRRRSTPSGSTVRRHDRSERFRGSSSSATEGAFPTRSTSSSSFRASG